jgi:hypothetical protein
MPKKITVADLVMLAGAVVTVLFSFFDFFDEVGNAWDTDFLAFASTVPAILALVMGVWIVLELTGTSLPEAVLTFSRAQLKATWAITAAGIMLSWLTVDAGGADKGIGFWLMFLGSIAMAVGAVMALLGKGTDTVDIPGASTPDRGATTPDSTTPPPPPAS